MRQMNAQRTDMTIEHQEVAFQGARANSVTSSIRPRRLNREGYSEVTKRSDELTNVDTEISLEAGDKGGFQTGKMLKRGSVKGHLGTNLTASIVSSHTSPMHDTETEHDSAPGWLSRPRFRDSQQTYLKNLCLYINFESIQLLDDTVTEQLLTCEQETHRQKLRLKTPLHTESEYAVIDDL